MSKLENQILLLLSQQTDFIDAQVMSSTFNVSAKTIYRAINKLNSSGLIIESKRGQGYRLISHTIFRFENTQEDKKRQLDMAVIILSHFPNVIKQITLTDKFYISESTLIRDLKALSDRLDTFNIQLLRSSGQIKIIGTEIQVRKALNYFLLENARTQKVLDDVSKIFPNISESDQTFISGQMSLIEQMLDVQILDPYTINIFSHLYILLQRMRRKRYEAVNILEPGEDYYDKSLKRVARQVVDNLGQYLNVIVPPQEIDNLLLYLVGLRYDKAVTGGTDSEAQSLVDWMINKLNIENQHININNLKKELLGHVRPMLHRISSLITVVNPLLNDIKFSYPDIFNKIKIILDNSNYNVSDDEIGFLTLYVVRAIEEATDNKKVILMCSTGVGTAQLLQTKVKHAFPYLEIIDIVSSRKYQKHLEEYKNVDLVISTVNVMYQPSSPVIQVSALFNEGDRRRVKEILYG